MYKIIVIILSLNLVAIIYGTFINYIYLTNSILLFIATCVYLLTVNILINND